MILSAISDLHLTDKTPKNRCDDYTKTSLRKFEWLLKNSKDALVIAGDIFDYPTVPRWFLGNILLLLNHYGQKIYVVPGQHDLRYHTKGLDNTSLGIIIKSGHATLLTPDKAKIMFGIKIVGLGWEEKLKEKEGDILVTHQMVTESGPLWSEQEKYFTGSAILNKYKGFKCVISGDNHKPHCIQNDRNQVNINCGSVMRSSKDQINHKPQLWHIDTEKWEYWSEDIPIEKSEKVFDFSKIELEEKKADLQEKARQNMDKLIKGLEEKNNKPDYKKMVKKLIKEKKPNKRVISIISDIMEEIY